MLNSLPQHFEDCKSGLPSFDPCSSSKLVPIDDKIAHIIFPDISKPTNFETPNMSSYYTHWLDKNHMKRTIRSSDIYIATTFYIKDHLIQALAERSINICVCGEKIRLIIPVEHRDCCSHVPSFTILPMLLHTHYRVPLGHFDQRSLFKILE